MQISEGPGAPRVQVFFAPAPVTIKSRPHEWKEFVFGEPFRINIAIDMLRGVC